MRSFWAITVCSMLLPHAISAPVTTDRPRSIKVLSYAPDTAHTSFRLPCQQTAACSLGVDEADESLVFDLQVNAIANPFTTSDIILNGQRPSLRWSDDNTSFTGSVTVDYTQSGIHAVDVAVSGWADARVPFPDSVTQTLLFNITAIDNEITHDLGFVLVSQPMSPHRLRSLEEIGRPGLIDFSRVDDLFRDQALGIPWHDDNTKNPQDSTVAFDLAAEVETLSLLESEATSLHAQIIAKKKAISVHLMEHRGHVSLNHLLEECDGLICAAKVVAQRICRKIGVATQSSFQMHGSHFQDVMSLSVDHEKPQQTSRNSTKTRPFRHGVNQTGSGEAASLQLFMTKNSTANQYIDLRDESSPFINALKIIAGALGLISLYKCIRRKCMSMRKRVERAADKEERRNARAYRRAARRANMRRRWDGLVNTMSCFRADVEPRCEDYEEKRALILQDAFLEQLDDMENAEKGEVMEAEIRELRHAQEIVASLVRVDDHRYTLVTPMHDPPPPLVPLPYTPESRSRASTHTLPSYTSESLPDYSSQPETPIDSSTNSVVDGFTHYTPPSSNGDSLVSPSSVSGGDQSSIVDVSPRISEETLRTRQSKDSRDL